MDQLNLNFGISNAIVKIVYFTTYSQHTFNGPKSARNVSVYLNGIELKSNVLYIQNKKVLTHEELEAFAKVIADTLEVKVYREYR